MSDSLWRDMRRLLECFALHSCGKAISVRTTYLFQAPNLNCIPKTIVLLLPPVQASCGRIVHINQVIQPPGLLLCDPK